MADSGSTGGASTGSATPKGSSKKGNNPLFDKVPGDKGKKKEKAGDESEEDEDAPKKKLLPKTGKDVKKIKLEPPKMVCVSPWLEIFIPET